MRIAMILTLILVSGCVTTGTRTTSVDEKDLKKNLEIQSSVFLGQKNCPKRLNVKTKNWRIHMRNAAACIAQGKLVSAEREAKALLEKSNHNPWGYYFSSVVAHKRKQFVKAKWMIEKALSVLNNYPLFLYEKGRIAWSEGDRVGSVYWIEKALKEDSNLVEARVFMGSIYLADYDYERASQEFIWILQRRPNNKIAQEGLRACQKAGVEIKPSGEKRLAGVGE